MGGAGDVAERPKHASVQDAPPFELTATAGLPDAPAGASSRQRPALSRFELDIVDDDGERKVAVNDAHTVQFAKLRPIRMPGDHKRQFHLSGFYLSDTTGRHVRSRCVSCHYNRRSRSRGDAGEVHDDR